MNKTKLTLAALIAVILTGCADPALERYVAEQQAAIARMPNGPEKTYAQMRLNEQVFADQQARRERMANAIAAAGAGLQQTGNLMQEQQIANTLANQHVWHSGVITHNVNVYGY
jgi:hypothetical protein